MILVFDIETVPDTSAGRQLYHFPDTLSDEDVAQALFSLRRQKTGHDFLPHHLQKVVAISCVFQKNKHLKVFSLGTPTSTEPELLTRFFNGLEKHMPTLISWNGSGFDLPVLHYRALIHGITARQYWEFGEQQSEFRWNNYLNRYHYRHLDLMDVLSGYQRQASAPLDEIASLIGFPGKMGMHGAQVWTYYQQHQLEAIRHYCETDVLNTYGIYLRFQYLRGQLSKDTYHAHLDQLKDYLAASSHEHWHAFLSQLKPIMSE